MCLYWQGAVPLHTEQVVVPHQAPSSLLVTFIWVAITKDKGKDSLKKIHALPTFLPQSAAPHVVGVQIPEDVYWAEPNSRPSAAITSASTNSEARVVATPANCVHRLGLQTI